MRLDLVMRWIMRENERMEWRSAGLRENGNRIAAGKFTVNAHPEPLCLA